MEVVYDKGLTNKRLRLTFDDLRKYVDDQWAATTSHHDPLKDYMVEKKDKVRKKQMEKNEEDKAIQKQLAVEALIHIDNMHHDSFEDYKVRQARVLSQLKAQAAVREALKAMEEARAAYDKALMELQRHDENAMTAASFPKRCSTTRRHRS